MRSIFILFSMLYCSLSFAQTGTFEDWDADGDGLIERYEFTSKFVDEYFAAWDPTDTRGVIEEGFFRNTYAGLDTDNDNFLSDEEWLIGTTYFYDEYVVYEDVDLVDTDEDGQIDYDEFYDALYETEYFTDIDMDGDNFISEYELAHYVFENWDYNDTGMLNRSEFARFDSYYLDV